MATPPVFEQEAVHLADKAQADRHPAPHPIDPMLERRDIAGDFLDVFLRYAGCFRVFVLQEIGEGGAGIKAA